MITKKIKNIKIKINSMSCFFKFLFILLFPYVLFFITLRLKIKERSPYILKKWQDTTYISLKGINW